MMLFPFQKVKFKSPWGGYCVGILREINSHIYESGTTNWGLFLPKSKSTIAWISSYDIVEIINSDYESNFMLYKEYLRENSEND